MLLSLVSSGQECEFHSKNKKLLKVFKHEVGVEEVIVCMSPFCLSSGCRAILNTGGVPGSFGNISEFPCFQLRCK